MENHNHHIEENVEIINKAWFKEILDYCDSAVCEPRDLINAHKSMQKQIRHKLKANWYQRKDKVHVLKVGWNKLLEIHRKNNGEYTFYKCLVFNKGEIVAAEGIHGSSLRKKYQAVRWGCKKAKELNLL